MTAAVTDPAPELPSTLTAVRSQTADPTLVVHRCAVAALAAGVLSVYAAAAALAAFAVPVWDDFMRATRRGSTPADVGWLRYVFDVTYLHWQGRWASCGLEAAVLPHLDPTRFYLLLIGPVVALNAAALLVVCRSFARGGPWRLPAGMTAAGLALAWSTLPQKSLAECVYWFVGAVENTLPLSLGAVVLVGLTRPRRPGPAVTVVLATAAFVACGMHEMYGAMLCLALAIGTAVAFATGSDRRHAWLAVGVTAAAGLAVVVGAPGNHQRMKQEGSHHGHPVGPIVLLAVRQLWANGRAWLFDPKLIAASLWVAFSPALEAARTPWPSARRVPWWAVVPAAWLAIVAVGFAAPSWAFGADMPDRTLGGNCLVFVAGWLLCVYVWTRPLAEPPADMSRSWQPFRSPVAANVAALVLGVSLVGTGNLFSAGEDLARRLRPWHARTEQRFADLRRHGGRDAVVPRLPVFPYLLLSGEVVDDPADFRNRGLVQFFNLRRLTLAPLPTTGPAAGVRHCEPAASSHAR